MTHIFREADKDDFRALEEARREFTSETGQGAQYVASALSEAMGAILDCLIDRDCDGDRRIGSLVYDPASEKVYVITPIGPHEDYTSDEELIVEIGRVNGLIRANHAQAQDIIGEALSTLARGDHTIERGQYPTAAASAPDTAILDRVYEAVRIRMLDKGILTSESDGWPELDPDLITDVRAIFMLLRTAFPETAGHLYEMRDRKGWEEFLFMPTGPIIGRGEMSSLRSAIQEASRLFLKPIERADQLDGHWHHIQLERKSAKQRAERRIRLRTEMGQIEGLTDGLSEAAAAAVRLWVEEDKALPIRPDTRDPQRPRNGIIEELRLHFGENAWARASTGLYGQGEDGVKALSDFVRFARAHLMARAAGTAP